MGDSTVWKLPPRYVLAERGRICGFLRRPEERMQVSGKGGLRQEKQILYTSTSGVGHNSVVHMSYIGFAQIDFFSAVLSGTSNCYCFFFFTYY